MRDTQDARWPIVTGMHVELLYFDGCPNWRIAASRRAVGG